MADDYGVRSSQFLLSISRTDDHIIALIAQGMVIPKDDVLAAIAQGVLGTDEVIGRTACYGVVEAFYIVQFRTGNRVAEAHDLRLIGFGDVVPAADSHDLAAAFRNSLLQGFFQVCRGAALHGAGVDVDIFIGICDGIAGAQDNGGVGIGGHIALADDAVSYAAKFLICARVLVQVQGAQGDRSCAPQVDAGSRTCIHDTGIRAYYGRSNTGGTGFKARCHTSPGRSAVVILIGTEAINLWPFFDRVIPGLGRLDGIVNCAAGDKLIRAIVILGHCAGADCCSPGFLIIGNICCFSGSSVSFFQVCADIICPNISLVAGIRIFHRFFQLGNGGHIRIRRAVSYVGNTTESGARTYGYIGISCLICFISFRAIRSEVRRRIRIGTNSNITIICRCTIAESYGSPLNTGVGINCNRSITSNRFYLQVFTLRIFIIRIFSNSIRANSNGTITCSIGIIAYRCNHMAGVLLIRHRFSGRHPRSATNIYTTNRYSGIPVTNSNCIVSSDSF